MTQPIRLGVAGLGTVGCGLLRLMEAHAPRLAETVGRHIVVTGVSARSRDKTRGVKLDAIPWFSDPVALAADRSIDVFVELIGGDDGPAKAAVEAGSVRAAAVEWFIDGLRMRERCHGGPEKRARNCADSRSANRGASRPAAIVQTMCMRRRAPDCRGAAP